MIAKYWCFGFEIISTTQFRLDSKVLFFVCFIILSAAWYRPDRRVFVCFFGILSAARYRLDRRVFVFCFGILSAARYRLDRRIFVGEEIHQDR